MWNLKHDLNAILWPMLIDLPFLVPISWINLTTANNWLHETTDLCTDIMCKLSCGPCNVFVYSQAKGVISFADLRILKKPCIRIKAVQALVNII